MDRIKSKRRMKKRNRRTGVSQKDLRIEKIVLRVSKKEKNARIARSIWAMFNEIESR